MPHPFEHDEHHRQRHWRGFEAMARRGFRGWGQGGFGGNWGGFGENFRIGRMLASGDLRLVALYLIEQQPRHGYDLIKAIEEKTAGLYSPSPGIVYPALTFLEEAGYVTSAAEGNKKLYTITDEGRTHLNANRAAVETTLDFLGKAGERMKEWRDGAGRDWPFGAGGPGDSDKGFDEDSGPFPHGPPHHHGPHDHGPGHHGPRHDPRHDRDIPGVTEEVNAARKDLKAAIADALDSRDEDTQRRLADILRKAAELIRRGDVDLG